MAVADRHGLPPTIHVTSASPHEVTLVPSTIQGRLVTDTPERRIGGSAHDSYKLDALAAHKASTLLRYIRTSATSLQPKAVVRAAGTASDGQLKRPLHDCREIVQSSPAMTITLPTSLPSLSSVVS